MTDILKIENGVLRACTDKSVTSVVIPEGVRRIGRIAFLDCASLVSVEIPEGVRYIDERAFNRCSSLESVVLPSSVTEIGEYAFRTCKSLKSVVIKSSATKICEGAFEYCESITSVEFSGTVAQWKEVEGKEVNLLHYIPAMSVKCSDGEWQKPVIFVKDGIAVKCLYNKATSVEIPEGVTAIGKNAFSRCKSLTSVVIPPSVTEIGVGAFQSCESLSAVEIPPSVTKIGEFTFFLCSSLKSVVIPSSVTEIGEFAFSDCKSLSTVTLGDDFEKVPFEWFDSLNEANPNYEIVCTEGSSTYKAVNRNPKLRTHLNSMEIAKEKKIAEINKACVTALLSSLLKGVSDSSFDILSNTNSATTVLVKIGKNAGVFKLGEDSSKWLVTLRKVIEVLSDSIKSGADIFAVITEQGLPLAEIPENARLTTLKADSDGSLNFFAAGELDNIQYEDVKNIALFGVTKIGEGVFHDYKSLESVEIPDDVTEIGESAFIGCNIDNFSHPLLTIENGCAIKENVVLYCTSQSDSIKIPDGVTEIGESAFRGCMSLSSVVIPSSVTEICESAFYDCTSLSSVVIPSSVTVIGEYAFCGCKSLTSVEIPEGVTEIGEKAFEGCNISELSHPCLTIKGGFAIKDNVLLYCTSPSDSITIPEGVTEICESAFYGCTSLASVEIPPSITEISERAFEGCTSLSSVAIGEGVTKIDWCAFRDCSSLSSVVIPPSVTKIDWCAFYGCSSLSSVSIPPSVAEIGKYAFFHCDSLSSVEFGGTMAQWKAVKKGKTWNGNASAKTVKCADGEAALA